MPLIFRIIAASPLSVCAGSSPVAHSSSFEVCSADETKMPNGLSRRLWAGHAAALLLGMIAGGGHSEAALMHAGASDAAHTALGVSNRASVMWVKGEVQGYSYYFSAIRINEYYAIAPAHTVNHPQLGLLIPALAGTGTNYLSDLGDTTTISEVLVHPEYDRSFAKPDIAIFKLSQPFVGSKPTIATVGSLSVGEFVTAAGFGVPGFTNTGFSAGGNVRGWNAPILDEGSLLFNPTYYGHTGFSTTAGVSLNGRCSNGDSGAGVYDSDGGLVGMTIGSTPGTTSYEPSGTSIFLDLTEPTIRAWIEANTVVPRPSIGCMVVADQMQLSLSNLVPTREYRIMRTSNMLVWEEAHRFTPATASNTWSEPLVSGARRFYRLEWQE